MEILILIAIVVVVIIVVWIIREFPIRIYIVGSSDRRLYSRDYSHTSVDFRRQHNHESTERKRNLPVKTICKDLNISFQHSVTEDSNRIDAIVSGGIRPYKYYWNGVLGKSYLEDVDPDDDIVLDVVDARKCKTSVDVRNFSN